MKKIVFALISFISINVSAQTVFPTNEAGDIEYKGIIQTDSATAKELRLRSKICLTEMFNSFKDVIQNDDGETNIIMIKAILVVNVPYLMSYYDAHINFSLNIEFKESRYRYTIIIGKYTLYHPQAGVQGTGMLSNNEKSPDGWHITPAMWRDMKNKTNAQTLALIQNLRDCMNKVSQKDDW